VATYVVVVLLGIGGPQAIGLVGRQLLGDDAPTLGSGGVLGPGRDLEPPVGPSGADRAGVDPDRAVAVATDAAARDYGLVARHEVVAAAPTAVAYLDGCRRSPQEITALAATW
jgi:hypothetical protein